MLRTTTSSGHCGKRSWPPSWRGWWTDCWDDPVFIQPFRVHFDTRLAGGMPDGASRLIVLHDPDVGPLRKGRIGPPVEFGYKAQVLDNPDGIVLEHQVMVGNPPDAPLLAPAVRRVIARTGNVPRAVTADRGYGEARVDRQRASAGWSVAHRLRGPDQLPQAPLRLGPHPDGRHPRRPHLLRPRHVRPQLRQDRRAAGRHITQGSMSTRTPGQATTTTSSQRLVGLIAKRLSGANNLV
jgi:transposase, IS5 family